MLRYCQNPPLGTTRDAKIRIQIQLRTPMLQHVRFSSKNRPQDVEKGDHAPLARFGSLFRLFSD